MRRHTHCADLVEMSVELGGHVMRLTHAPVNARKTVVAAEKVYMVTTQGVDLTRDLGGGA